MSPQRLSPNIRKGKFQWMEPSKRSRYLEELSRKIADGYFASDEILNKVVDELAPVFHESVECDG